MDIPIPEKLKPFMTAETWAMACDAVSAAYIAALTGRAFGRPSNGAPPKVTAKLKAKRHIPAHCLFPGCKKPHKGANSSFTCDNEKHRAKAGTAQTKKWLADWKKKNPKAKQR